MMTETTTRTATVTVDRKTVADMVSDMHANTRTALPILGTIRIVSDGHTLTLTATDLETSTTRTVSARGDTFVACAPAAMLRDALKGRGTSDVTLTYQADTEELRIAGTLIRCLPVDDYPEIRSNQVEYEYAGTLGTLALRQLMSAASTDYARPLLCALNLSVQDGIASSTTCDSYRLVTVEIQSSEAAAVVEALESEYTGASYTVYGLNKKKARWLPTNAKNRNVEVGIHAHADYLQLHRGDPGNNITLRRCEGSYPNWRQLMPDSGDTFTIDPGAALDVVKSIPTVLRKTEVPIRISADGSCRVMAQDVGEWEGQLAGWDAPFAMVFNPGYFADMLSHWQTNMPATRGESRVKVTMQTELKPVIFAGANTRGLLMPVRV